jgi:hypothetical protein
MMKRTPTTNNPQPTGIRQVNMLSRIQMVALSPARVVRLSSVLWGACLFAGCGADLYEQRLANTQLMFAHKDLQNKNLQGFWSDPETGIGLRPPAQFNVMAPPAPTEQPAAAAAKPARDAAKAAGDEEPAEEEGPEVIPDDRQPKYMNFELPGLRGAFTTGVKYIAENNVLSEGEGFLYILSNHEFADQPEQAREFSRNFVRALSETVHVVVEPTDWKDEIFPTEIRAKTTFVRPVKYKNVTVTSNEEIAGYARQFSAYIYEQGDIQVIVLFVLPNGVDSSERLTDRIPLCLETLGVAGSVLVAPMRGGVPAGGGVPTSF